MSVSNVRGTKYRADIDGLRAVAVVPVVLYHAGLSLFGGGFVGVDVFFVISGYLITSILHAEAEAGTFSIAGFYERRVRRIIPALLFLVAGCSIAAWLLFLPEDLAAYGRSAVAALLSFSNVTFGWEGTGYFQTTADLKPLLHTWSLGVEEQFYVVFPIFLYVVHRTTRLLVPILWLILIGSFALAVVLTASHPSIAFYLSPPRAWELLAGSVLAVGGVPRIRNALSGELAAAAGLIMLLAAILAYTPKTPFPGLAALPPCVGTALMIHAGPGTRVAALLRTRALVFIGLISYSLYLWHWPLLAFTRYFVIRELTPFEASADVALAFLLAVLSWRFVERPFRRRSFMPSRPRLFALAAAAVAACAAPAALFLVAGGLPSRVPPKVLALAAGRDDATSWRARCLGLPISEFRAGRSCRLGGSGTPTAILWGDSHSDAVSPAFAALAAERGTSVILAGHHSCPPARGVEVIESGLKEGCAAWSEAVLDAARSPDIGTVFLIARWASYVSGVGYGADASKRISTEPAGPQALARGLERTLQALRGKKVVIILSVPEQIYDAPSALARRQWFGSALPLDLPLALHEQRQAPIAGDIVRLAHLYGATVVDPAALFCAATCALERGGRPLYYDNHHLSTAGALALQGPIAAAWGPAGAALPAGRTAQAGQGRRAKGGGSS